MLDFIPMKFANQPGPLANQPTEALVPPIGSRVPDLPVHYAPRPWYRTW